MEKELLSHHSNFFSSISALLPAVSRNFRIYTEKFQEAKKQNHRISRGLPLSNLSFWAEYLMSAM